jgi:hypothetical protein
VHPSGTRRSASLTRWGDWGWCAPELSFSVEHVEPCGAERDRRLNARGTEVDLIRQRDREVPQVGEEHAMEFWYERLVPYDCARVRGQRGLGRAEVGSIELFVQSAAAPLKVISRPPVRSL